LLVNLKTAKSIGHLRIVPRPRRRRRRGRSGSLFLFRRAGPLTRSVARGPTR
jgi:hypothetical protein